MIPLLDETGAPITVPEGPVDPALRAKIEKALAVAVPEGKRFGLVALYDLEHKTLDAQIGVRIGGDWKFVVSPSWNKSGMSGFVGLAGSF